MRAALKDYLRSLGVTTLLVRSEVVTHTNFRRFLVVAQKFASMRYQDRQEVVWRIARTVLTQEEQLLVSMIVTVTPREHKELKARWP